MMMIIMIIIIIIISQLLDIDELYLCLHIYLHSGISVEQQMASNGVFSAMMIIMMYIAHTASAAVIRRDPYIGACLCTTAINGLIARKHGN